MISKTAGAAVTYFDYDKEGHAIGEYDGPSGATLRETVWLGDTPVAVLSSETVQAGELRRDDRGEILFGIDLVDEREARGELLVLEQLLAGGHGFLP